MYAYVCEYDIVLYVLAGQGLPVLYVCITCVISNAEFSFGIRFWSLIRVHIGFHALSMHIILTCLLRPYQFNFMLLGPEDLSSRVGRLA